MAENFDLIFGQSASSQYEWNDNDYQNGWGTVGSTPPTAEQFDALQRRNDKKAQELNSALTPLVNQSTASNRQPLAAYALKDIRYYNGLPVGWYLECSTAGTSGSGDITLPTPLVENATITDGTVTWKVRKISNTNELAGKADRSLSNLTDAGKSFSFPSGTYVAISTPTPTVPTKYTAPYDGYAVFSAVTTEATNGFVGIINSDDGYSTRSSNGSATAPLGVILPVKKGTNISYVVNGTMRNQVVRFYYAQGEVPE